MVPANHTIHVHFTNFSLYDTKDALELYKRINGTFKLNYTYHGRYGKPFTFTATSDLEFVFRSDQAHNSTGFRAEYDVFIPCGRLIRNFIIMKKENPNIYIDMFLIFLSSQYQVSNRNLY
jgi:hypothetical protein